MHTIGVYLIFAAVALRAAVVLSARAELPGVMLLLAAYGLLLFGKSRLMQQKPSQFLPSTQMAYLFLQSLLVIGALIISSYEDFLAMLFIPLSLDAVSVFGRRVGFLMIAFLSLAMTVTLLFSDVGWIFGLVMGMLYTGMCFLMGGYAHQVQKAKAAHDQNEHMLQELQTAHHQLQGYADHLISLAVEQERNRLARELHDSVTQTVFSMNLAAQSAHLLLDKERPRVTGQLLRIEELAASAQREIQSLISQLRPRSIVEEGLPNALRQLASELKARNGLQVSLEIHGDGIFSVAVATCLYSVAHEALMNTAKHSGTCQAIVRLKAGNGDPSLEIEDHGSGFHPDAVMQKTGHLGLAGMQERAREIGWNLSIKSSPGYGTKICVIANSGGPV